MKLMDENDWKGVKIGLNVTIQDALNFECRRFIAPGEC
jgi:hypothetical protein